MSLRGKTLFVSNVVCFLKSEYPEPEYIFDDDFLSNYCPELLIYNNDKLIFVEIKSEKEINGASPDYKFHTFHDLRQKVKTLPTIVCRI